MRMTWWGVAAMGVALAGGTAGAASEDDDERARSILNKMSERLAGSKTVQVRAERELDASLAQSTGLPEKATLQVWVMRPNRVRAESVAANDSRVFLADGQRFTVVDRKMNLYGTVPASGTIDEVSDLMEQRFGFAPPLGELLSNDPAARIGARATTMAYGGERKVNDQVCERVMLKGEEADAELCVSPKTSLPVELLVTFADQGRPKLRMTFSEWNLNAPVRADQFVFTPKAGAQQVEMVPLEKLEGANGTQESNGVQR
jgi:hypothetical protein